MKINDFAISPFLIFQCSIRIQRYTVTCPYPPKAQPRLPQISQMESQFTAQPLIIVGKLSILNVCEGLGYVFTHCTQSNTEKYGTQYSHSSVQYNLQSWNGMHHLPLIEKICIIVQNINNIKLHQHLCFCKIFHKKTIAFLIYFPQTETQLNLRKQ